MNREHSRDWIWLVVFCTIGLVLGSLQSKSSAQGSPSGIEAVVRSVVSPVSHPLANALDARDAWFFSLANATEVRRLRQIQRRMNVAMSLYNERVDELNREIDSLRSLVELAPLPGRTRVAADVIAMFPSQNRMSISVGFEDGVRQGMPVVTGEGMVGIVQSAGNGSSVVTLLSSPSLRIGAMALRNPPAAGLLRGESFSKLILEFLDFSAPVQNNDLVVTSGYSERIPRGLPIGRIFQLEDNKEFGTRRSQVFPLAKLETVREVYVLK